MHHSLWKQARQRSNFRLAFRVKIDDFGVATAFKVEDALVAPAVTDERAIRVAAQGRLSGPAQPKEEGSIVERLTIVGAAAKMVFLGVSNSMKDRQKPICGSSQGKSPRAFGKALHFLIMKEHNVVIF